MIPQTFVTGMFSLPRKYNCGLVLGIAILSIAIWQPSQAQSISYNLHFSKENIEASNNFSILNVPPGELPYPVPPQVVGSDSIHPYLTIFPLNGVLINHLTEWQFDATHLFAETTDRDILVDGTLRISDRLQENTTSNNIYQLDQRGNYLQVRSIPTEDTITTTIKQPETLIGEHLQFSVTATCIFPETDSDQHCTYTSGVVTDRNSIDPDLLTPTDLIFTSQFGDVVQPETLEFMKLPGFQGGTASQPTGWDWYDPNMDYILGNSQSQRTAVEREEEMNYTIAGTFSRIRQILRINDREAVLGRTIQGFTLFLKDENRWLNTAVQAGAQLLPTIVPSLEGSSNPPNTNINQNLFLAANNTRLPNDSLTIYSAGIGRAESLKDSSTNRDEAPRGSYHSIWLGLSPVIEHDLEYGRIFYQPTGPEVRIPELALEGNDESRIGIISAIKELYSIDNLENVHAQEYGSTLQRDVNLALTITETEETSYYPHVSLTGNWTANQDVLRYYAGVIAADETKLYLGTDYTRNTDSNWHFRGGLVGYTNPDREYYSEIWGYLGKTIPLSEAASLVLSTNFQYAFDRETEIGHIDITTFIPTSEAAVSAGLNWGIASLFVTNYFEDLLPDSDEKRLLAEVTVQPLDTLFVSVYVAPID